MCMYVCVNDISTWSRILGLCVHVCMCKYVRIWHTYTFPVQYFLMEHSRLLSVQLCVFLCVECVLCTQHIYTHTWSTVSYRHSYNKRGPRNSFQRLLVPVYYWKPVEKLKNGPQILWNGSTRCAVVCFYVLSLCCACSIYIHTHMEQSKLLPFS